MEKKELRFYEAPAFEVVELKHQGILCASKPGSTITTDDDDWAEE